MVRVKKISLDPNQMFHAVELPAGSFILDGSVRAVNDGKIQIHYLHEGHEPVFPPTKYAVTILMTDHEDNVFVMNDWYKGWAEIEGVPYHVFVTYAR